MTRIEETAMRLYAERGVTQVSVCDLAKAAGVSRGTIYNNHVEVDSLFGRIATRLGHDMDGRIQVTLARTEDPARRLAIGLRLFARRTHDEPVWGRFHVCFSGRRQ